MSQTQAEVFPEDWYDYAEARHFWFDGRTQAILMHLKTKASFAEPLRALDIGCGSGTFGLQLEKISSWTVDSVNVNEKDLMRADRNRRGQVFAYDIFENRADMLGRYDAVFMLDVLEHIEHPKPFLDAAAKYLKPGGRLVLNVPALPSLYFKFDEAGGHFRRYTQTALLQEIQQSSANFQVEHLGYWGFTMIPLLWLRKMLMAFVSEQDAAMEVGFKMPSAPVNWALKLVLRMERLLLPYAPIGSSVLAIARRP